jgi:hypothetical protein
MSSRVRGDVPLLFAAYLGLTLIAAPARAQDGPLPARAFSPLFTVAAPLTPVSDEHRRDARAVDDRRGLLPLYISFASLQMLDAHATLRAVRAGAVERNPLLRGVADKPAALVALKVGVAVSTIALADRVSRRNRVAALVLMAALNSAYTAVVLHNYRAVP